MCTDRAQQCVCSLPVDRICGKSSSSGALRRSAYITGNNDDTFVAPLATSYVTSLSAAALPDVLPTTLADSTASSVDDDRISESPSFPQQEPCIPFDDDDTLVVSLFTAHATNPIPVTLQDQLPTVLVDGTVSVDDEEPIPASPSADLAESRIDDLHQLQEVLEKASRLRCDCGKSTSLSHFVIV